MNIRWVLSSSCQSWIWLLIHFRDLLIINLIHVQLLVLPQKRENLLQLLVIFLLFLVPHRKQRVPLQHLLRIVEPPSERDLDQIGPEVIAQGIQRPRLSAEVLVQLR